MKKILLALTFFATFAGSYPNNCVVTQVVENTVAGSTTPTLLAAQKDSRRCLTISNKGSNTVYITFTTGTYTTEGVPIPAGGNWDQVNTTTNNIYAHALVGTTTSVVLVEGK